MNRDDIIRMAREVKGAARQSATDGSLWLLSESHLEAFAALVATERNRFWDEQLTVEIHEAVLEEREACAKVCEAGIDMWPNEYHEEWNDACEDRAKSIRARGETK